MQQDKLKSMFPNASASTLRRNPGFGDKTNVQNYALTQFQPVSIAHKKNKYGNVRVEHEGMKFDSKKELKCWQELKLREQAGEIINLKRQVRFDLEVNGKRTGKITVDFTWYDNQTQDYVVADTKSEITRKERSYRMKKKHFEVQYAPLVIREL